MNRRYELRAADHGFTLLELLVAITLLGLLMAALFGGLRLNARVWENADARLDGSIRIQVVQDFVRRRLAETLPLGAAPPELAEVGVSGQLFLGTVEAVRFVSLMPEHLGAGVYLMELVVAGSGDAGGTGNLVLRWRPLGPNDQTEDKIQPQQRVLIESVEALELSYFGTIDPIQAPDWWEGWEGQPELPRLVRVRLRFPKNDERQWPELIVRPMVDRALAFWVLGTDRNAAAGVLR